MKRRWIVIVLLAVGLYASVAPVLALRSDEDLGNGIILGTPTECQIRRSTSMYFIIVCPNALSIPSETPFFELDYRDETGCLIQTWHEWVFMCETFGNTWIPPVASVYIRVDTTTDIMSLVIEYHDTRGAQAGDFKYWDAIGRASSEPLLRPTPQFEGIPA